MIHNHIEQRCYLISDVLWVILHSESISKVLFYNICILWALSTLAFVILFSFYIATKQKQNKTKKL